MLALLVLYATNATATGGLAAPEAIGACAVAARPLAAGEPVTRRDVRRIDCRSEPAERALHYDRTSRRVVARADIAPGTYLGRVWLPASPAVRTGDAVHVRARIGPVEVRRSVRALQDAQPGQRFFVVDAEGQIFAAPPLAVIEGEK